MEFMNVITSRKSVRDFLGKAVEEEKLMKILEAARLAPSWANKQGCKYVVVKNKSTINELATGFTSWLSEAPVILAACIDPKDSGSHNGMDYYLVDVGISMQQLVLAATDLGLGTCWIGGFDEDKVKKVLEIPSNIRVVALTPIGYPAPMSERSKTVREFVKAFQRKPLESMVHREKW
ncbi:MAG: nitroreductase family protein [Candidatus Bathyarchaeia archaeon]|jgi:nitroreductase